MARTQLQEIIRALSGPRYASMQYTPDENRVTSEYGSAWQLGLYLVNLPPEKDRSRWNQLRTTYEKDPGFRDQLLQRFFSAEFRNAHYKAIGKPALGVVAAKPAPSPAPAPSAPPAGAPPKPLDPEAAGMFWAADMKQGDELRAASNCAKAIERYQSAIRVLPERARAHVSLGACYITLEQYENAVPPLQQALRLEPGNLSAHVNLGSAYYYLEKDYQALSELLEAKRLKADNAPTDF